MTTCLFTILKSLAQTEHSVTTKLLKKLAEIERKIKELLDINSPWNSEDLSACPAVSAEQQHKPTVTFSLTPPPVNVCTKELHSRVEESAVNSSDSSEKTGWYSVSLRN